MKQLGKASMDAIKHESQGEHETRFEAGYVLPEEEAERIIAEWPEAPQTAAKEMLERYGAPNEGTPTKLFWYDKGPWKRIFVTKDIVTHNFPMPHSDFIAMTIDYQVPVDKFDDITRFDGSCMADRTTGEVTARCDSEWANILTLNLMNDIVTGKKTVDEARKAFADMAPAYAMGRSAPYAERLQFKPPKGETEDVDESMVAGPMVKQGVAKMIDALAGR